MKAILETIGDAFFGVITFFANLSISRYDDPSVADFKRRKIACVVSTGTFVLVVVLALFVASQLDALAGTRTLGPVFVGLREPVGYAFLAGLLGTFVWMTHSGYALLRFLHDGGNSAA